MHTLHVYLEMCKDVSLIVMSGHGSLPLLVCRVEWDSRDHVTMRAYHITPHTRAGVTQNHNLMFTCCLEYVFSWNVNPNNFNVWSMSC